MAAAAEARAAQAVVVALVAAFGSDIEQSSDINNNSSTHEVSAVASERQFHLQLVAENHRKAPALNSAHTWIRCCASSQTLFLWAAKAVVVSLAALERR